MNSSTFRVSLSGIGKIGKKTKVMLFALMPYLCTPLVNAAVPMHALDARFVVSPSFAVLDVFGWRNNAQIFNAVIAAREIDVIQEGYGPLAVDIQPRKPVAFVSNAVNFNVDVSVIQPSCGIALNGSAIACIGKPVKPSGFRIVVKKFAQALRGKIGLSHDALLMLIGQRPASADNASGLRYFKGFV